MPSRRHLDQHHVERDRHPIVDQALPFSDRRQPSGSLELLEDRDYRDGIRRGDDAPEEQGGDQRQVQGEHEDEADEDRCRQDTRQRQDQDGTVGRSKLVRIESVGGVKEQWREEHEEHQPRLQLGQHQSLALPDDQSTDHERNRVRDLQPVRQHPDQGCPQKQPGNLDDDVLGHALRRPCNRCDDQPVARPGPRRWSLSRRLSKTMIEAVLSGYLGYVSGALSTLGLHQGSTLPGRRGPQGSMGHCVALRVIARMKQFLRRRTPLAMTVVGRRG